MKKEVIELDDFLNEVRDAGAAKVYYAVIPKHSKPNKEGQIRFKSTLHLSTINGENVVDGSPEEVCLLIANITLVDGTMSDQKDADELDSAAQEEKEKVIKNIKNYMASKGIQVIQGAVSL